MPLCTGWHPGSTLKIEVLQLVSLGTEPWTPAPRRPLVLDRPESPKHLGSPEIRSVCPKPCPSSRRSDSRLRLRDGAGLSEPSSPGLQMLRESWLSLETRQCVQSGDSALACIGSVLLLRIRSLLAGRKSCPGFTADLTHLWIKSCVASWQSASV